MVRPVSYSGPSHSTSPSIGSAASSVGSVFFLPQYMHVADPSYISLDAANAIISSYPPPETTRNLISKDVSVTPSGLRIVNLFLDYMLHEFLARARATSLLRLREAVALVIRTTLGTAAMVEAEQELAAYLHDSDHELYAHDDESEEEADGQSTFNLEKVWARARTKCMIYSTLGDKEEEDFIEEPEEDADYDIPASKRKLSPAGAIYLTAVLEFIGEHCLLVSARTAYQRLGNSLRAIESSTEPAPLVIDEGDVKRGIAEDDLTTRIWRKWKRSEKLLTTISSISGNRYGEPRRVIDSRTGSETLTRLPFTPAQASRELGPIDARRNSIMSAPDMSRGDSSTSVDSKTQSLPPVSPTKPHHNRKHRHRHSKVYSESGSETVRQSGSVTDIKETLGERGVMLPDSPHSPRASPFEGFYRAPGSNPKTRHRLSALTEGSLESPGPLHISSRGKEILPIPKDTSTDDGEGEYQDAVASQDDRQDPMATQEVDDPLKTPTLKDEKEFFTETGSKVEDDVFVMGGDAGLDYSIWETKVPVDQRFYFSPPGSKHGSVKSQVTLEHPSGPNETNRPATAPTVSTIGRFTEAEPNIPVPSTSKAVETDSISEMQIPKVSVHNTPSPTPPGTEAEEDSLPGSWPKQENPTTATTPTNTLALPQVDSDADSIISNHVNDKIARQMRELDREQKAAATVGLGLQSVPPATPQAPIYVNHTELTPIMETSPRESMISETVEPVISSRVQSSKGRSSDEHKDVYGSPPPTRHSHSSAKVPMSPTFSTHSDKARTSSLTSQAERLRSKFLNRKGPPEDLTVDTFAADPVKTERRMKFEHLIRSGETMKMTLTPTSLRSIEGPISFHRKLIDDNVWGENRTLPERVRQQVKENSTRELADFLRSTGPESFHPAATGERRGSVPTIVNAKSPVPDHTIRSMPSTPVIRNRRPIQEQPSMPSPTKPVARSPVNRDSDHSTLQLAAFIRTTGPPTSSAASPVVLGGRNVADKVTANSVHSNGDSSTSGLLKYQSVQSQRYPPSPSTSTQYGTLVDGDEDDDSDDYELSMYPGARRKQKATPQEESLMDFLRSTGPPEPALPPSPTTPKAFKDRFPNGKKKSRSNVKSNDPPQPKAVDIFQAAKVNPPRVMSPTPSTRTTGTVKGNYQVGGSIRPSLHSNNRSFSSPLNVNVPSPSLMGNDDYFSSPNPRAQSVMSTQSNARRFNDRDEIQSIRTARAPTRLPNSAPREPVSARSQTTDSLAEFLRSTGPADFSPPTGKAVKKSKSGFFRRLWGNNNEKMGRLSRSGSVSTTGGRYTPIVIPATVRN